MSSASTRREAKIRSVQGSECIYAAEKDAKRIVRLALGEFPSNDEAMNAYTRARGEGSVRRTEGRERARESGSVRIGCHRRTTSSALSSASGSSSAS